MSRVQTMVQLTDELISVLDSAAARKGVSRSSLIRTILEEALAADREAEIGRRIAEGYRRIPPATPDGWGDVEAMDERANRDLMRRLDEEERRAGVDPWRRQPRGRSR